MPRGSPGTSSAPGWHLLDRLAADAVVAGALVRRAGGDNRRLRHGLAIAADLLGAPPVGEHPADSAFAQVDAGCQAGSVLLCIDDAHLHDTASIGLLRRLAWPPGTSRLRSSSVCVRSRPGAASRPSAVRRCAA